MSERSDLIRRLRRIIIILSKRDIRLIIEALEFTDFAFKMLESGKFIPEFLRKENMYHGNNEGVDSGDNKPSP